MKTTKCKITVGKRYCLDYEMGEDLINFLRTISKTQKSEDNYVIL
jgi:hypothetical protein